MDAQHGAPAVPARSRELLAGAERAFAHRGYFGTSTASVAAEIGVSQPYVMQVFGSKERLFVATHRFSGEKIVDCLQTELQADPFDLRAAGRAYQRLVSLERDAVRVFAHGFSAADVPAIGVESRRLLTEVHGLLRDAGASRHQITDFLGRGMLTNTLLLLSADRDVIGDGYDVISALLVDQLHPAETQ
ncbi:TetR/AcrR family transcriptional regulator [Leifsonia shinshuensis]|uniref:TetR/AcrR family transcriptional regulator n=1 Tax=Leifsonia shinshuensis TaxID=150026 RepID=UPI001F504450|nr:TetR/AcrR family transcriptional regulator [Leifsonia shinshuensis]MCI0158772.1 TetR/AcrR family transcriptional regulator [Leifsonia shinshuensis]